MRHARWARAQVVVLAVAVIAVAALLLAATARADSSTLVVIVTGPDGEPVPFARAELSMGATKFNATIIKGRGEFKGLPNGARTLLVFGAAEAPGKPLPLGPWQEAIDPDDPAVDVRLPKGVTIEGRVVNRRGRGLKGIPVVAHLPSDLTTILMTTHDAHILTALASTVSGPDGAFTLIGLGEQPYLVLASPRRTYVLPPLLRAAGGTDGHEISLYKAKASVLKIKGPDGKSISGAKVMVWRVSDETVKSATSSVQRAMAIVEVESSKRGRVDVPPLDPRLHLRITVDPPSGRGDLVRYSLEPWKPASGTIALDGGFEAVIRVQDEGGKPLRARVLRSLTKAELAEMGGGQTGSSSAGSSNGKGVLRVGGLSGSGASFQAIHDHSEVFPNCSPSVTATRAKPEITLVVPRTPLVLEARLADGAGPMTGVLMPAVGELAFYAPHKQFEFDENGVAKIPGVGAGRYMILALGGESRGGRIDDFPFPGKVAEIPMVEPPGIRVHVKIPEGVAGVTGVVSLGLEPVVARLTPQEGDLWFAPGLPAGRYSVAIFGTKDGKHYRADATLVAGAEPATLTLEPDKSN